MKITSFNIMDERIIAGTDVSRRGGKNEERMLPFCRIQFVESYTSDSN